MSQQCTFDSSLKVLDNTELKQVSGGLIGPDQNIQDFPPWLWPVIRPGQLQIKQIAVKNLVIR